MTEARARALLARLGTFLDQFTTCFGRRAHRTYASRYLQGLLNDSGRKSMQPMHARLSDPGSYQGLQHFITHSTWEARPFWQRLHEVIPVRGGILAIDDTGLPKQGTASVGVQRQYCGALGKVANCQVAVSTALIAGKLAWLTSLELYLPQIWMDDESRASARIPRQLPFREKWRIAVAHVRTMLADGFTLEAVVADAAYGEIAQFRAALERLGIRYVVAVPYFVGARLAVGMASQSLAALANTLAPSAWHRIRWGHGTKGPLEARFAAIRVRIPKSRSDRWLLCQASLVDGERQYYFSNLPPDTPLKTLVRIARSRWAIEVQYRDLKTELGLDHFEGRSYTGWNHHGVLAAMTFTFLQLERRRRRAPLPTFPEIRDLLREVMAALLWTARPGWSQVAIGFQRNPPLRI
ncbi:MAG: IS701 family transposase [Steroidobacteraceae bacterium]